MIARSILLVVAASLAAPAIARADTTAVVVAGDPGKKGGVVDAIAPWLEGKGGSVMLDSVPAEDVDKLVDCFIDDSTKCAKPIVASSGVAWFLFVMIEVDPSQAVTLTGWLFAGNGSVLAQERTVCETCRADALAHQAQELAATLWRKADPSHASVRVVSDPAGAEVVVDGTPMGKTPVEVEVTPGAHQIEVRLDGHEPSAEQVDAVGGKILPLQVTLERSAVVLKGKSRMPWFVIGGGGAAIVVSGILFAIDEDDPPPGPGRPEHFTDTGLPAALLGTVGVAAVGVGVYLLLRRPAEQSSAPVARVSSDTVVLGWQGRF